MPFFDETIHDVGIFAGEVFGFAFVVGVKDDQGAVCRFGERAGKDNFSTAPSFGGQAKVFLPERSATSDKVIDNFVKQSVVVHRGHLFR